MARYDKALRNLANAENSAINWLLGPILSKAAKEKTSHFFLDALEKGRTPYIVSWNYWFTEDRNALLNPADAARKALHDLQNATGDAESKLLSVFSEVWAVGILKNEGL